jgi:hypothetical protein
MAGRHNHGSQSGRGLARNFPEEWAPALDAEFHHPAHLTCYRRLFSNGDQSNKSLNHERLLYPRDS